MAVPGAAISQLNARMKQIMRWAGRDALATPCLTVRHLIDAPFRCRKISAQEVKGKRRGLRRASSPRPDQIGSPLR
ncbi:hypothetical protein KCP76_04015 [Salmonella enterica subsp. enterica serovar Weltevreden]|nr:hypothetical protein KCP76_04015 [Salmonella enterica subsp. enterica serovar Weltevreden]